MPTSGVPEAGSFTNVQPKRLRQYQTYDRRSDGNLSIASSGSNKLDHSSQNSQPAADDIHNLTDDSDTQQASNSNSNSSRIQMRRKRKRIEQDHRKRVSELFATLADVLGHPSDSSLRLTRPIILEMAIERLSSSKTAETDSNTSGRPGTHKSDSGTSGYWQSLAHAAVDPNDKSIKTRSPQGTISDHNAIHDATRISERHTNSPKSVICPACGAQFLASEPTGSFMPTPIVGSDPSRSHSVYPETNIKPTLNPQSLPYWGADTTGYTPHGMIGPGTMDNARHVSSVVPTRNGPGITQISPILPLGPTKPSNGYPSNFMTSPDPGAITLPMTNAWPMSNVIHNNTDAAIPSATEHIAGAPVHDMHDHSMMHQTPFSREHERRLQIMQMQYPDAAWKSPPNCIPAYADRHHQFDLADNSADHARIVRSATGHLPPGQPPNASQNS